MFCYKCGKRVSNNMKYCPFCGYKLVEEETYVEDIAPDKDIVEELYQKKKYNNLLDMAVSGNILAMYYYIQFISNKVVASEYIYHKEIDKLKKLCDENILFAKTAYGFLLYQGSIRKEEGFKLIVDAYNSGDIVAKYIMSQWKQVGNGLIERDSFESYRLLKQASDAGYPSAMYTAGFMHYKGNNVSKDEKLGIELIEKAAFLGDEQANKFMRDMEPLWKDQNFGYWLNEEAIDSITDIVKNETENKLEGISFDKYDEENSSDSFIINTYSSISRCQSVDDYIELFNSIKSSSVDSEEKSTALTWLSNTISSFTSTSGGEADVNRAKEIVADKENAIMLAKRYVYPQHFLHFKDDLIKLKIYIDSNEMPDVMLEVSDIISSNFKKEIGLYEAYANAKKKKKDAKSGCLPAVVWTIFAFIGITMFPIVGIIIGLLSILCWLGLIYNFFTSSYTATQLEGYRLINSLIGYGYKLTDSKGDTMEVFDETQKYNNKIKSILE